MTAGRVHPKKDGTTSAECAHCSWTFETTKPGEAAHELMQHNTEEHTHG